jgi:hypothetical protein
MFKWVWLQHHAQELWVHLKCQIQEPWVRGLGCCPSPRESWTWRATKSSVPGLGRGPSLGYVDLLQNPGRGKKRPGGLVCTQQAGLQPACAGMHPPPRYTAFTRGFANLRAGACRPTRLCMQPGARASPYRSGLGRPSARCLQPEVESRRAGLAWQP